MITIADIFIIISLIIISVCLFVLNVNVLYKIKNIEKIINKENKQ